MLYFWNKFRYFTLAILQGIFITIYNLYFSTDFYICIIFNVDILRKKQVFRGMYSRICRKSTRMILFKPNYIFIVSIYDTHYNYMIYKHVPITYETMSILCVCIIWPERWLRWRTITDLSREGRKWNTGKESPTWSKLITNLMVYSFIVSIVYCIMYLCSKAHYYVLICTYVIEIIITISLYNWK